MRGALIEAVSPFFLGEHPRIGGEHMMLSSSSAFVIGIPLRIRGARIMNHQNHMSAGNIPAYAGSTDSGGTYARFSRDHSSLCGEHSGGRNLNSHHYGASPRMRGALRLLETDLMTKGIIPAYAGSTLF